MRPTIIVTIVLATLVPQLAAPAATPDERLDALFDSEWERTMEENPDWASQLGIRKFNDRWPDRSIEAIENSHAADVAILRQLDAFNPMELTALNRINLQLFRRKYQDMVDGHRFRLYLMPLNQRDGIQDANSLADSLAFDTVRDCDDWIARLEAFPEYVNRITALMREGARSRIIHPKVVMRRVPAQIDRQLVDDPEKSLFFKPFREFSGDIPEPDRTRIATAARTAITEKIVPAYRQFKDFFANEYLPACYDTVGARQMPNGTELYAHRCRHFTTTDLTADEIHKIGLNEVQRIRGEMEQVVERLEFKGSFAEFLEQLRTDKRHYYDNANDLIEAYRACCRQVDPLLPKLFHRLPKIPYGIEAIPMNMAPDTTTAYYRPPSADGRRAGTYFVNLYRPEVRPRYEIEALSLHESVPGHHLQIALAMEFDDLPDFRRYEGYTAFVEGWALYSEKLGEEIGLYQDPYSKFGQLTYEMWRAIRLVVDTGMHHKNWTRQQAIDLFTHNTAKTLLDIENEVDRYISWPGQALAYKIGELKIRELRTKAEKQLGDHFDVRDFHQVVLENGAVTLDILEDHVDAWIAQTSP